MNDTSYEWHSISVISSYEWHSVSVMSSDEWHWHSISVISSYEWHPCVCITRNEWTCNASHLYHIYMYHMCISISVMSSDEWHFCITRNEWTCNTSHIHKCDAPHHTRRTHDHALHELNMHITCELSWTCKPLPQHAQLTQVKINVWYITLLYVQRASSYASHARKCNTSDQYTHSMCVIMNE